MHGRREPRVSSIGADRDPCALGHRRGSCARASTNAAHAIALENEILDGKALTQLDARFDRGIDEHGVEQRSTRAVAECDPIHDKVAGGQGKVTDIERE